MSNFGDKAATLVQDISQSEKGTIPPYNDELVRAVDDVLAVEFRQGLL